MAVTLRQIILGTVPTIAAIIGFLWFRRKKKNPAVCATDKPKDDVEIQTSSVTHQQANGSVPKHSSPDNTSKCLPFEDSIISSRLSSRAQPLVLVQSRVSPATLTEHDVLSGASEVVERIKDPPTIHPQTDTRGAGPDTDVLVTAPICSSTSTEEPGPQPQTTEASEDDEADFGDDTLPQGDHPSVGGTTVEQEITATESFANETEPIPAGACPAAHEHQESSCDVSLHESITESAPVTSLPNGFHKEDDYDREGKLEMNGEHEESRVNEIEDSVPEEVIGCMTVAEVQCTPMTTAQDSGDTTPEKILDSHPADDNDNMDCDANQSKSHVCETLCKSESEPLNSTESGDRTEVNGVLLTNGDHREFRGEAMEHEPLPEQTTERGAQSSECDQVNCDVQSEVSSDSGRGASCIETPTTTSPSDQLSEYVVYDFDFPTDLCGRLIGKSGKNINSLKDKAGVEIMLKRKSLGRDLQTCSIEGTQSQVMLAIELIKAKFPSKQFPQITYEQTNLIEESPVLSPEIMQVNLAQLSLPEGVTVDVIVSSVVDANHVFVQQPTHPTFSSLENLNYYMNLCYTQDNAVPPLPRIEPGYICAAPIYTGWFRAQVVAVDHELGECDIKFVDYGGYLHIHSSVLKQIRSDFATLPFQATECYLSNIIPLTETDVDVPDEEGFGTEASAILEEMVQGQMLQAQIVGQEEDGIPYIQLYSSDGQTNTFVNRKLINMGVARWVEMQQ